MDALNLERIQPKLYPTVASRLEATEPRGFASGPLSSQRPRKRKI